MQSQLCTAASTMCIAAITITREGGACGVMSAGVAAAAAIDTAAAVGAAVGAAAAAAAAAACIVTLALKEVICCEQSYQFSLDAKAGSSSFGHARVLRPLQQRA